MRRYVCHMLRSACAVPCVCAVVMIFGFNEIRQHVIPSPARITQRRPIVKIMPLPAHMHHGVDGTRPADNLSARPITAASAKPRNRFCVIHPIDTAIEKSAPITNRKLYPDGSVGPARLKNQHCSLAVCGQPLRKHASRCARANDDIVKLFGHWTGCCVISRCSMFPV